MLDWNGWEASAVELVARIAPWFAPLPTAWLVYERTMRHLSWPQWVAIAAGVTLELLGVAILATALRLYEYNRTKRKNDPAAPLWIALLLVALYLITAELLTVVLDTVPQAAVLAPALFPVLSVAAFGLLALRSDHYRRLEAIDQDKAEARAKREQAKQARKRIDQTPEQTPKQPARFVCLLCGRSFDSQAALNGHGNKHREERHDVGKIVP